MSKLEETLEALKGQLDSSPEIQEYLSLKRALETNQELRQMRLEIARLTSVGDKKSHDNLLEIYNNHPLVVNYQNARDEVISLLAQIKDILSD